MTTTTSCNKDRFGRLLKGYLKKNRSIMVLLFAMGFFCLPFQYILTVQRLIRQGSAYDDFYGVGNMSPVQSVILMTGLWLAAAAVVGLMQLAYMHNRRAVDLYHSLPVTRGQLMGANFSAAWVTVALPMTVNYLITIGLALWNRSRCAALIATQPDTWGSYTFYPSMGLYELFVWLVALAGMLAVAFFISTQVGTVFDTLLFTAIACAAPAMVIGSADLLCQVFLFGFTGLGIHWQTVGYMSPATLPLVELGQAIFGYDVETQGTPGSVFAVLLWIVLAAAFLALAILVYRRRPSEKAESSARSGFVSLLVKLLVMLTVCPLAGVLIGQMVSGGEAGSLPTVLGTALTALLAFFIMEAVLGRSAAGLLKRAPLGLALTALAAFYVAVMSNGCFGLEGYMPDVQKLESVTVNQRGHFQSVSFYEVENMHESFRYYGNSQVPVYMYPRISDVTLESDEAFALTQDLQRAILDQHEQEKKYGEIDNQYGWDYVTIQYKLDSGRSLTRRYNMAFGEAVLEKLGLLLDCDEMYAKTSPFENSTAKDYRAVTVTDDLAHGTAVVDKEADIAKLLAALQKDTRAESFAQLWDGRKNVVASLVFTTVAGDGYECDTKQEKDFLGSYGWEITDRYTNTMDVLRQLGLGYLLEIDPAQITGATLNYSDTVWGSDHGGMMYFQDWDRGYDTPEQWMQTNGWESRVLTAEQAGSLVNRAHSVWNEKLEEPFCGVVFHFADGSYSPTRMLTAQDLIDGGCDELVTEITRSTGREPDASNYKPGELTYPEIAENRG